MSGNIKAKSLKKGDEVHVYGEWMKILLVEKCNFFPRALTFCFTNGKDFSWMEEADVYKK
jgi:hypothetical protein